MRTTLTLEDDIAVRLERERRRRGVPFKTLVNEVLRTGLDALQNPRVKGARYRTRGWDLGPSLVGSLDNVEEALSRGEGEGHK